MPKRLAPESSKFLTFNINLWVIVCSTCYEYIIYYVTMTMLLLNRGQISLVSLVKYDIKPFIKYILYGEIDRKYEIRVSELTPPPNFSLIPLKIEKLVKSWTLTPKTKTKNDVITENQ